MNLGVKGAAPVQAPDLGAGVLLLLSCAWAAAVGWLVARAIRQRSVLQRVATGTSSGPTRSTKSFPWACTSMWG